MSKLIQNLWDLRHSMTAYLGRNVKRQILSVTLRFRCEINTICHLRAGDIAFCYRFGDGQANTDET